MDIDEEIDRAEFLFVLSRHIGPGGPLKSKPIENLQQSRLLSVIAEAFDEINAGRAEKDRVGWTGFTTYLIFSTRRIQATQSAMITKQHSFHLECSQRFDPLPSGPESVYVTA